MSDYEEEYEESASSQSSVSDREPEPEPEPEYEETREVARSESRSSSHSHHSNHSHSSSHHSGSHSGDEGAHGGGGLAAFAGGHGGNHGSGGHGSGGHGSGGGAEKKIGGILGGMFKQFKKDKDKEKHSGGSDVSQAQQTFQQGYGAPPSGYPGQGYQAQPQYQNQQSYSHDQYPSRDGYYTPPQGPPVGGYAPPTEAFGTMGLGGQAYNSYGGQNPGTGYGGYPDHAQEQGQSGGYGYGGPAGYAPEPPQQQDYYATGAGYVPQAEYQAAQPPYGPPPHVQYHSQRGNDDGQPHQQHYGPTFTDPQTGEVAQAFFEYSRCNGTKKALLIGINYFGTSGELAGCINDVHNVQKFICERFGYQPADIVILTDDINDPRTMPTRENIIKGMRWLVEGAKRDDSLFLHYSGHGTQTEDLDGDEGDDDDEAICPVDYQSAGLIIDDETMSLLSSLFQLGVDLPPSLTLVCDLPYIYTAEGKIKEPDLLSEAKEGLLGAGMDILKGDTGGIMSNLFGAAKSVFEAKQSDQKTKRTRTSPADVIQWAGCKDSQTSADTQEEGKATGAMSYAFIAALNKYPNQSYRQLLTTIREEMKGKYTQIPQLSACHPIDTDLEFVA